MSRRLPPLNQLRAFEAAARHLSFKDAASELNVTHTAVSHQIRGLEDFLGTQLFQRITRGVRLTDEARALAEDLRQAFDLMDGAVRRFEAGELTGSLRISVVPWYGNRLILPRLAEFHAAYPGLVVDLGFSYELVDFSYSDFNAALRHGLGDWPNLGGYKVHGDRVTPLCAPGLIEGRDLPLDPKEIARMDIAVGRGQEESWYAWLKQAGVDQRLEPNFVAFDNRALATEFALGGNGVCLPDLAAMELELTSGQLVRLHPAAVELESGLHLVFPETPYPDPRIAVFAEWLTSVFAAV